MITIGNERFRAAEALFKPSLLGLENSGIDKLTVDTINKCDIDVRSDLVHNIVLSGGSTMYKGLPERMQLAMEEVWPSTLKPHVVAPAERK